MPKDDGNRLKAVELAKRLLVDAIWKTANIEVDGITFPDAQEIFEGRAPSNMEVNDIIVVNNIKRAWMFLFENTIQRVSGDAMTADLLLSEIEASLGDAWRLDVLEERNGTAQIRVVLDGK